MPMSAADAGAALASFSGPTSLAFVSGVFPSLADNGGGLQRVPELAEEVDETYLCCSCRQVLRQPRQTPCGHRICTPCLELLTQQNGDEPFHCPADEDGCVDMTIDQITPDFSASRYLRSIRVYCTNKQYGCPVVVTWHKLKTHVKDECKFTIVPCPNDCGVTDLEASKVEEHRRTCPRQPKDCHFRVLGCDFRGTEADQRVHVEESVNHHLELSVEHTAQAELDIVRVRSQTQEVDDKVQQIRSQLSELATQNETLRRDFQALSATCRHTENGLRSMSSQTEAVQRLEERVARVQAEVTRELASVRDSQTRLERRVNDQRPAALPEEVRTQMIAQDRMIGLHDVRLAELDLRVQCAETTNYDGILIWKIIEYPRRKHEAVAGTTLSLYSQPFYTSRYGYKMCARVYLNGDGAGRGTHVSLFFVVMQGDYDELIAWPFRQKVTLSLLDQKGTRKHLADAFRPDPTSSSFQRPTNPMNVASGCPMFIEHTRLEAADSPYLVNDTLFFKITVDTSDLLNP